MGQLKNGNVSFLMGYREYRDGHNELFTHFDTNVYRNNMDLDTN